jgi:hypothetical protein
LRSTAVVDNTLSDDVCKLDALNAPHSAVTECHNNDASMKARV